MKKRDTFPRILGKAVIALFALLMIAIAWLGIDNFAVARPSTLTQYLTATSTSAQDTISFSTQKDTPVADAVRVDVSLKDFAVTSSVTTFHIGTPYYFVVVNKGPSVHEFTIVRAMPDGKPVPNGGENAYQLFEIEQIAPGTSVSMNYTFTLKNEGAYEIDCLMRGHYMAGMRLPITIAR